MMASLDAETADSSFYFKNEMNIFFLDQIFCTYKKNIFNVLLLFLNVNIFSYMS